MLHRIFLVALSLVPCAVCARARAEASRADGVEFFEQHIRPLLVEQCYRCHSAQSEKLKGGLLLDSRAGLLKGGDSQQTSLVPGDPDHSVLIKAVQWSDDELRMPPKQKLSAAQIADLVAWVKMGAPDPRVEALPTKPVIAASAASTHWAFQPVRDVAIPSSKDGGQTAIDRFVNAKLEAAGIRPVPPADKFTLIRRATYDLTGLPPTVEQIRSFVEDSSPDAFAKLIDRLLASPQYGEHWGRHWLDLARYADTAGESADFPVPQAYRYRNYVIDAFNADKPYDQFIEEQIAGDLMPAKDEADRYQKVIATGFLATAKRFGVAPEHEMHLTIDDTIDTLGKSMLGLSLNCCRCHDHKFDPLTSKEYYSLYGFFASTRYPYPGSEERKYQQDFVPLAPKAQADALLTAYHAKLDPAKAAANEAKAAFEKARGTAKEPELYGVWQRAMKAVAAITAAGPGVETAYAVTDEAHPHDARVLKRGEAWNQGDVAPRGFPAVLGGQKLSADCKDSGRLELARWIASPTNPLTARVMVNRIWQHHFDRGIVKTPSDFGTRGAPPTHPELLDYLAKQFVAGGWSVKAMHRAIMLSDAYQRSNRTDPSCLEKDGNNDLLWRFDRRRLEAEEIRDSILATSGELDPTPGGAQPFPTPDKWNYSQHDAFSAVYPSTKRSVYVMQQRIKRHPFFAIFDGADPNATTAERTASTTPLQALYMMNDLFVHAQSLSAARRAAEASPDLAEQVRQLYWRVYGRAATSEEVEAATQYVQAYAEKLGDANESMAERPSKAVAALVRVLWCSNEFFYVD